LDTKEIQIQQMQNQTKFQRVEKCFLGSQKDTNCFVYEKNNFTEISKNLAALKEKC